MFFLLHLLICNTLARTPALSCCSSCTAAGWRTPQWPPASPSSSSAPAPSTCCPPWPTRYRAKAPLYNTAFPFPPCPVKVPMGAAETHPMGRESGAGFEKQDVTALAEGGVGYLTPSPPPWGGIFSCLFLYVIIFIDVYWHKLGISWARCGVPEKIKTLFLGAL